MGGGAAERGQAIVFVALMLGVVVGMAALAIDGSRAYAVRRDLQNAVDSAALAAGDNFQRTSSYTSAEQAATTAFGINLRLYSAPSCAPGYGTPGPGTFSVTCTYSDGTSLTDTLPPPGPQGAEFRLAASRTLSLQFARILTNGSSATISSSSSGRVGNLLYSPALAALDQAGCGGQGGAAISVAGSGTLQVTGDVVSSGAISVSSGSARVAGDIYARCQASVPGTTLLCYPSGANPPCSYPDVAGAVRSGYAYADPAYPVPGPIGSGQAAPGPNVVLVAGVYAAPVVLSGGRCYFLSGGVYDWQAGFANVDNLVSNELKPPDEPDVADNTKRSTNQFWDSAGIGCSGSAQVATTSAGNGNGNCRFNCQNNGGVPQGRWSFVLTSTRSDTYSGVAYQRESAPSMCYQVIVGYNQDVTVDVSNVPGATAYNIYAAPPNNGCDGPFGLVESLPVSGSVQNTNLSSCPNFTGNGCSLRHESVTLDTSDLGPPFAPNALAAAGTPNSYPPNSETPALSASLPNQNAARLAGAGGDRANENNCDTAAGAYTSCPAAVTPGAVVFYLPGSACMVNSVLGDTYVFSGYQYNWVSMYQPATNGCAGYIGGRANSAFIGLVYAPGAAMTVWSPYAFEAPATGGLIAKTITFNGALPTITFSPAYAPVPFAARLVS